MALAAVTGQSHFASCLGGVHYSVAAEQLGLAAAEHRQTVTGRWQQEFKSVLRTARWKIAGLGSCRARKVPLILRLAAAEHRQTVTGLWQQEFKSVLRTARRNSCRVKKRRLILRLAAAEHSQTVTGRWQQEFKSVLITARVKKELDE